MIVEMMLKYLENGSYDDEEFVKHVLESPTFLKIFHDCRNDAKVLRRWKNIKLNNVYDTQVAYFLFNGKCEFPISLGNLISRSFKFYSKVNKVKFKEFFKDKSYWARRPFSNDALRYIMEDVFFLPFIYYEYEIQFDSCLAEVFHYSCDYLGLASRSGYYGIDYFDSQLRNKRRQKKKKVVVKPSKKLVAVSAKKLGSGPGKQPPSGIKFSKKNKVSFSDNKKRTEKKQRDVVPDISHFIEYRFSLLKIDSVSLFKRDCNQVLSIVPVPDVSQLAKVEATYLVNNFLALVVKEMSEWRAVRGRMIDGLFYALLNSFHYHKVFGLFCQNDDYVEGFIQFDRVALNDYSYLQELRDHSVICFKTGHLLIF